MSRAFLNSRGWIASALLAPIVATGAGLAAWKYTDIAADEAAAANQPEPMEAVTAAAGHSSASTGGPRRRSAPCSRCARSRCATSWPARCARSRSTPGQVVEAGAVLVALDVSVEEAELEAQEAQAGWRETTLDAAAERCAEHGATSQEEVDQARAERDVALAQIARTKAVIARKTIRAPFRARVGIADVHPGQYLNEGTELTTLQGVDDAVHVDFTVAQRVAAGLRVGDSVEVYRRSRRRRSRPAIVAVDARVDPDDAQRHGARAHRRRRPAPVARRLGARARSRSGPPRTAVVDPGERAAQGPGRRSRVRDRGRLGRASRARTCGRCRAAPMLGDEVLILDGLEAGEQVAASGSFKLREGVLVAVAGARSRRRPHGAERRAT